MYLPGVSLFLLEAHMPLNEQKGNMYPFVTHTWNPIKGKCSHDCSYCYMKRFPQNPIRLDEKDLRADLGTDNFIFVGSSTDMWASDVPGKWIENITDRIFDDTGRNRFLFQSKNPGRFLNYHSGGEVIYGTTIETNREYGCTGGASTIRRAFRILEVKEQFALPIMITIEPILDFDLSALIDIIDLCRPEWVNIGADSKGHGLLEPPGRKVKALIAGIERLGIEVKQKDNLKRLLVK
jgi:DNA repair photolyase